MVINFSLIRLFIIFVLVILFPLVQKQWLNLYLFDINNLSIYKLLYYLSGLIVPILVIINSLNKFTYYKFNFYKKINNYSDISGKSLFIITLVILSILSILISNYIFINLKIILNLLMSNNEYLVQYDIDKQILFVVIISIFLIFKKTKFIIKKIILTNFFIFSIINWYSQINNNLIADANFSLSNFIGSQYEEKYGYQLLNDISGDFDVGVRYYPFKNSFLNIDVRNYNSPSGNGSSLDLDFMGITIKRLIKKGYIDNNFSIIN